MPSEIKCVVAESTFESRGVFNRLYNTIEAKFRQGEINHITGDVHYLSYFLSKEKTLLTILDCVFTQNTAGFRNFLLRVFWYVIPEKRVSAISVISQSAKDELLKIISCNPDKIRVIPVCISPEFVYKENKFNAIKPVILQVGTDRNKNLFRLFEALQDIPCKLDLIGNISKEHKKALDHFKIEYINSWNLTEEEIINKYQYCDIVTFASTYEGFGMPILEANAVGRVVVTSNILSMPDVAGNAACLVNPYEIDSIREGVLRVIKDDRYRESLVINGLSNVLRFSPTVIAGQYFKLYEEMSNTLGVSNSVRSKRG